jgi:hypothetical protein
MIERFVDVNRKNAARSMVVRALRSENILNGLNSWKYSVTGLNEKVCIICQNTPHRKKNRNQSKEYY